MRPARLRSFVASVSIAALGIALALLAGCESDNTVAPIPSGPPLSAVVVNPVTDTLQVGQTRQFHAQAYDTLGAPTSASFQWASTNTGVFTVNAAGIVNARGEGLAGLIVSAGGRSDTATVFVYPDTGWVLQPGSGSNLNGVFFLPDGRSGWAVGDGGRVIRTTDAGANWISEIANTAFNLNAVWFTSASEGWAVGDVSTVLERAGSGWTRVASAGAIGENLNDVVFATPDTGWVACSNGTIARTFDRGATWQKVKLPTISAFRGIARSGSRDGWAVGDGGIVAGTHDQGVTWFLISTPTTQSLKAVAGLDPTSAIAVGATGTVLRTVAGPDSAIWGLIVPSAGANNQLEGVHAIGSSLVFAVGFNASVGGAILRSDDGGLTWQPQASRTSFRLNDVYFVDSQRGWAVGDGGVIVHTARGGTR